MLAISGRSSQVCGVVLNVVRAAYVSGSLIAEKFVNLAIFLRPNFGHCKLVHRIRNK